MLDKIYFIYSSLYKFFLISPIYDLFIISSFYCVFLEEMLDLESSKFLLQELVIEYDSTLKGTCFILNGESNAFTFLK